MSTLETSASARFEAIEDEGNCQRNRNGFQILRRYKMIKEHLDGYRFERAVVGFGGTPTLWWMRFLKKGFYHCIVALGRQNEWLIIDPLLHFTDAIMIRNVDIKRFFKK